MSIDLTTLKPVFVRNCRMSETAGQEDMLLMPEGVIKIKGTGRSIIALCDGTRTIAEIIRQLKGEYPAASPDQIQNDAIEFLNQLRKKRVLDFK